MPLWSVLGASHCLHVDVLGAFKGWEWYDQVRMNIGHTLNTLNQWGGWKLIVVVFWNHPNHLKMIRFSNHYPFLLIHINLKTKNAQVSFNSTVAIGPFFITLSHLLVLLPTFSLHLQDLLQKPHPTSHQSPTPWQTAQALRRRERFTGFTGAGSKRGRGFQVYKLLGGEMSLWEKKIWKYEIWIQVLWRWTEMVIDDITWY